MWIWKWLNKPGKTESQCPQKVRPKVVVGIALECWGHGFSLQNPSKIPPIIRPKNPSKRGRPRILPLYISGTKKEPKPKLLSPDIFRWGGGLPCERVGAKKFGMSLETQGIKLFCRDIPGFCRDIPEAPEKFEKKSLCSIFGPYYLVRQSL